LILATSLPALADDAPVNLLQNFKVEETEKDAAGKDQPTHWEAGQEIPGVTYAWDRVSGVEKSGALRIKKTANKYFPISQWTQRITHDGQSPVIALSVQVKTKAVTKAILDVVFLDDKGEAISHEWVSYIGDTSDRPKPLTHDWKEYKGAAEIPSGTKSIVIGLQDYGPGTIMFDDVSAVYLKELPKEPNNVPK